MGMSIDDIKHCLKVMVDCEVCEECNLYGTTGTDHCEHDCIYGALDIIDKYQKIERIFKDWCEVGNDGDICAFRDLKQVICPCIGDKDGNVD